MEKIKDIAKRAGREAGRPVESAAAELFAQTMRKKGLSTSQAMMGEYLRLLNIKPVYKQEEKQGFAEMRNKLNSEPGVLISNHPGHLDTPVILNAITRTDVKALAGPLARNRLAPIIGVSNIIEASKEPFKQLQIFGEIKSHIREGGLFIMYPTGGDWITPTFQDGFRYIVNRILEPSDMIYACRVSPEDIKALIPERTSRKRGLVSDVILPGEWDINAQKEQKQIHVDEHYSRAEEWKRVINGALNKKENNQLLTEHFWALFGRTERISDDILE